MLATKYLFTNLDRNAKKVPKLITPEAKVLLSLFPTVLNATVKVLTGTS